MANDDFLANCTRLPVCDGLQFWRLITQHKKRARPRCFW